MQVEHIQIRQLVQILDRVDDIFAQNHHTKVARRGQLADFLELILRDVQKVQTG